MEDLSNQERFDYLLTYYEALDSPGTLFYVNPHFLKITIMRSGIFHKGGLSALQDENVLTGGKSHYPIENLQGFVEELASLFYTWIYRFRMGGFRKEAEQMWERFQDEFDNVSKYLIDSKIARRGQIVKIQDQFKTWQKDDLAKLSEMKKSDPEVRFKIAGEKIRTEALKIFSKHLLGVPDDTISKRCAKLLTKIGIAVKEETLRKRLYRAKTKTPTK